MPLDVWGRRRWKITNVDSAVSGILIRKVIGENEIKGERGNQQNAFAFDPFFSPPCDTF